jgi:hypothetical protein
MHSVPQYSRPDLAVKKLSKIPCYNALLPRNPLTCRIILVSPAIFSLFFPARQGKNKAVLPCSVEPRGSTRAIQSTMVAATE